MSQNSLITPEVQVLLGKESVHPGKEVVDATAIRRYAAAIGELDPLSLDEEYARKTVYGGIIAPPTFVFDVSNNIFGEAGEDGRELGRVTLPGMKVARGGNEWQFFEPVRPGDIIDRRRKIVEIFEKVGKKAGTIIFVVTETSYTKQRDQLLGVNRETLMFFK